MLDEAVKDEASRSPKLDEAIKDEAARSPMLNEAVYDEAARPPMLDVLVPLKAVTFSIRHLSNSRFLETYKNDTKRHLVYIKGILGWRPKTRQKIES